MLEAWVAAAISLACAAHKIEEEVRVRLVQKLLQRVDFVALRPDKLQAARLSEVIEVATEVVGDHLARAPRG